MICAVSRLGGVCTEPAREDDPLCALHAGALSLGGDKERRRVQARCLAALRERGLTLPRAP